VLAGRLSKTQPGHHCNWRLEGAIIYTSIGKGNQDIHDRAQMTSTLKSIMFVIIVDS
jgi:hypothetical protein